MAINLNSSKTSAIENLRKKEEEVFKKTISVRFIMIIGLVNEMVSGKRVEPANSLNSV